MTNAECLPIIENNNSLIDTIVKIGGIEYRINELVSIPPGSEKIFAALYEKDPNPSNRFASQRDLEVYMVCENLETDNIAILPLTALEDNNAQ